MSKRYAFAEQEARKNGRIPDAEFYRQDKEKAFTECYVHIAKADALNAALAEQLWREEAKMVYK
ncbi:MAG: hypothetical protein FD174_4327 [Geobacteraceae bacterium]|nr:MAG: hypothetical protein FD174_4327 [Geobacteraceae bacterium]